VATLEAKQSREGKECSYVRAYANWDSPGVAQQPMRARIAGRVTPSSTQSGAASLEMIELPLKMTPNAIACCQVRATGQSSIHEELLHYDGSQVPLGNITLNTGCGRLTSFFEYECHMKKKVSLPYPVLHGRHLMLRSLRESAC
jgi:hypothetical protein